jgi:hypothetical protein
VGHPVFARFYARVAAPASERAGAAEHRRRLVDGLAGEVGAGHGVSLPLYPAAVTRLVAVEPEARLRSALVAAAATVWPRLMGGCHTGRDTVAAVPRAGFTITADASFPVPATRFPSPAATHVLGIAVRGAS